jgi:hypothetical protein
MENTAAGGMVATTAAAAAACGGGTTSTSGETFPGDKRGRKGEPPGVTDRSKLFTSALISPLFISPDLSFLAARELVREDGGGGDNAPDLVTHPHQLPEMSPSVVEEYAAAAAVLIPAPLLLSTKAAAADETVLELSRPLLDMLRPILH